MFTDAFFATPAFQLCQSYKTYALESIIQYFRLGSARRCVALIDNTRYNSLYANATGATFQWVNNGA